MISLLLFASGLGLVDSVNPASIGFLIVLFPLLSRPAEGFWYVGGTFVTYLAVGLGIHLGLAASVGRLLGTIPTEAWTWIKLGLGIGLLAFGIAAWSRPAGRGKAAAPLRVAPWALFLLGASNTVFDLPTSLPYVALLARLASMGAGPALALPLLLAYNLVYIAPMLGLQAAYMALRDRLGPALARISAFLERANRFLLVGFPLAAGLLLTLDVLASLALGGGGPA